MCDIRGHGPHDFSGIYGKVFEVCQGVEALLWVGFGFRV